jgi:Protein of unknown function (DUF3450)
MAMMHRLTPGARCWSILIVLVTPLIGAADTLEEADKSAGEFVKLQVENARLETEWRSQRELLGSLVRALQERAASLAEKRDLTKAKTAKDREELDAIRARIQRENDDSRVFESRLNAVSAKLLSLRSSLPPHLSEALEMSYRTLAGAEAPPGERLQQVMNVLNRCAQFNRMVFVGEDVLTLEGEPPEKSLEVIYWGLSHGYAVDRVARKAWLGSPGPTGWRWEARPEAFGSVTELLAIAKDKADPTYVAVPATVTRSLSATPGH